MMPIRLLLLALLMCGPLPLLAADVEEPESVQEPEAPDTTQAPATPPAQSPITPAKPTETPQALPGTGGDTLFSTVILQGLNKVTARAVTLEVPIGSVVRFGTIEIVAHTCWQAAPEDRPENAALLEISEIKQGEVPKRIFLGWMFSSSPGLSSLEHPFYDVTMIGCSKKGIKE